jgi:Na+-transporting NADH:ubiquinone oxidoreductase subunit C
MKSFSNTYIFIFSTVMVTIVAILLSFVAETLRPIQNKNKEIEKKLDILRSVGKGEKIEEVKDKDLYVQEEYSRYITGSYVIDIHGEKKDGLDAFNVNLKIELAKPPQEMNLPVFVYTADDSTHKYIIPVRGRGLWGPIWGYISFYDDFNTIYGAIFDHEKETPGLGAEINQKFFQVQFANKKILDQQGNLVSVKVVKGGAKSDDIHAVDAISGGTITSTAVQTMMENCLGNYKEYIKEKNIVKND